MSEKPLPPQYGNYYGQQHLSNEAVSNITRAEKRETTIRDFLVQKIGDERKNLRIWRRFTLIASVTGVAVIFVGATGGIVVGLSAGALIGAFMGGMSTLAGVITTTFVQLVYNLEKKQSEQLDDTLKMLIEHDLREEQGREEWILLEKLDETDKKEVIKYRLLNRSSSVESNPPK